MFSQRTHRLAAVIVLVLGLGAVAGVAVGQGGDGDEYTACLTAGGTITKTAVGNEPRSPCATDQTEIGWNQTGPPGPPGPATLAPTYSTGVDDTRFEPGDPAVDFMTLDLPAGNYMFYVTFGAFPEPLYDPSGNPAGFAQGGSIECRFFEEAADGTRTDLTGVKHGSFGTAAVGSWSLDKSTPGAFVPYLQAGGSTYIHSHPSHPEGASVVAVCQHSFGELIDVYASWTALATGESYFQPSP